MTKLKLNSATAQFEELDLDLLSLVAAGAPSWLDDWQEDVFKIFGLDGRGLATVDETVSFYAEALIGEGITKDMIQECAELYGIDDGVTWRKKYSYS